MNLVLIGLGLGFLLAAQVGPVTLLMIRSVLRGGRAVAVGVAMAGAVAGIDLLYAAIGLAGAGQVLDATAARLSLGLLSAAILIGLGARTLWRGVRVHSGMVGEHEVATPKQAFATAVAGTALNPLTIALWTVSFPASAPHAAAGSTADGLLLLGGVALGTIGWYGGVALAVAATRRRIGPKVLQTIDILIGAALMVFGAVLGYRILSHHADTPSRLGSSVTEALRPA
jgi:threonine/homoserine/homoserine lactone efflux protein